MRRIFEMLQRMFFWAWKLRYNYDWEGAFIYEIIYLKLKRMRYTFLNHGHAVWCEEDSNLMRKLTEAMGLAKKLRYDYHKNMERFYSKYMSSCKSFMSMKELKSMYPNAKVIDEKTYRFFFKKAYEKDNNERKSDQKRLHYLLEKYTDHFWD